MVTISGKDMGTSSESVSAITLAGIPCQLIKEKYIVSKTYVLHFASFRISTASLWGK